MREKLRRLIGNLALLSFSLLFFYVVFGSLFLRYGPPFFLTIDHVFPVEANLWWQHSAPDPDKDDYIALLGDSHAKGIGDWRAQRTRLDESYHSADVIHAITGMNILSFGHGGIGSVDGFVVMPARALSADRCLIFPKPHKPTEVIYYFYEGNDLNNNLGFIARALKLDRNSADVQSATKRFFESLRKPGFLSCSTYFFKVIEAFVQIAWPIAKRRGALSRLDPRVINHLLVNDTEVMAPGRLQGPALELSDHDTELAFEIFDASLEWFQRANPDIKVMIVDIPSVLTNYHFARPTVTIQTYQRGNMEQDAARIPARSDAICRRLFASAERHGALFVDARPDMREAASRAVIHGPLDWSHPNKIGYTRLGETVAAALLGDTSHSTCASLAAN
jgi:hypothetical protein